MAEKRKAIANGVAFELKKAALAPDIAGRRAVGNIVRAKGMPELSPLTPDQIKSALRQKLAGQKYSTPDADPILTDVANEFEEFIHTNMPDLDMAFQVLFKLKDLRGSTHDHFDIIDTSKGITWRQRKPGEPIKLRKNFSESKSTVNYVEYAEGVGILDQWLQFNQFWNIEEVVAEFVALYYRKMAEVHYGLFTALGSGVDESYSTDDVKTANAAAATILRNMDSDGRAVGDNPTFYAVTNPENVGRLEKMLTAQRGSAIVAQGTVDQPLVHRIGGIISTVHVDSDDTGWYLVLPERKIQRGVWMDMTMESTRDITVSAEHMVGRGQYNAAIGNSDQVRRVKFS